MEVIPEKFKQFLPLPVTLITTCNKGGLINAAPYSSMMPVLRPLDLIAFASNPSHDTVRNIKETGEFVVNVMGRPSFEKAVACGKSYPQGTNELKKVGLATSPSKHMAPPRVRKAVGWIEAKREHALEGDRFVLIVGKVVVAEINDDYLKGGNLEELPISLLFPYFRTIGEPIARRDAFDV